MLARLAGQHGAACCACGRSEYRCAPRTLSPPRCPQDSSWSETGDRYCVKLFRDFAFHGAHPDTGGPLLDWGCIVEALNKVRACVCSDAGRQLVDQLLSSCRCQPVVHFLDTLGTTPYPFFPQLDAGVHEELLLLGRDGQSMLVVTYADVKVGGSHEQGGGRAVQCVRSQGNTLERKAGRRAGKPRDREAASMQCAAQPHGGGAPLASLVHCAASRCQQAATDIGCGESRGLATSVALV